MKWWWPSTNIFLLLKVIVWISRTWYKKNKFDSALTEWQSVRVMDTMMKVVCRASNRAFVGLPLCTWPSFTWILCLELRRQELGFCKHQCSVHSQYRKDGFHSSNASWLPETVSIKNSLLSLTTLNYYTVLLFLCSPWSRSSLSTPWDILHL